MTIIQLASIQADDQTCVITAREYHEQGYAEKCVNGECYVVDILDAPEPRESKVAKQAYEYTVSLRGCNFINIIDAACWSDNRYQLFMAGGRMAVAGDYPLLVFPEAAWIALGDGHE
jgi:hypothetical protein